MHESPAANFDSNSARLPLFRYVPRTAAGVTAVTGLFIIISWYAHWRGFLQLIPDTAPMQYNTALCCVLLGAGLWLLTTPGRSGAGWLGGIAGLIGGLTLTEYLTGWSLGIDQLLFKPWFEAATMYAGRMSPLTAFCFVSLGTGVVMAAGNQAEVRRFAWTGMLACIAGVISGVACFGFIFGVETAYGWGAYSRMAANTAVLLLVYSGGLLAWAWQAADHRTLLRWLPAAASFTLLVMVGIIATINTRELREATYWRQHTFQVILSAQGFLDNLLDAQRGLRGYVTMGDTNALAAYHDAGDQVPLKLDQLAVETRDNPVQQARLKELGQAARNLLGFDERVLATYRDQGFAGVSQLDATGQGRVVFGRTRDVLKAFSSEEQRLLATRSASETVSYNAVTRLLIAGCVAAAGLLLAGNLIAGREMRWRRRTEARLTAILTLQNAILSSSSYAIVTVDRLGVVKTFNPAAEKMLGYRADEVVGRLTPDQWCEVKNGVPTPKKIGMDTLLSRAGLSALGERETTYIHKDGRRFPVLVSITALADIRGEITGFLSVFSDISERKQREAEREKLIADLKAAVAEVNALSDLIPICAWCKNIRSDKGFWQTVEQFVHARTHAAFTHGICPECAEKMLADAPQ